MHEYLAWLRRRFGDDRSEAWGAERRRVIEATDVPAVAPAFLTEMQALARSGEPSALLGRAAAMPELSVRVPCRELVGLGHGLVLGGTGVGKTTLVVQIIRALLDVALRRPRPSGVWVIDHKSDLVALVRESLAALVSELPDADAERLLDAVVVLDPFSTEALVPLQILRSEPGIVPEVQAWEVTTLIDRMGGADLGAKQDDLVYHLALLGVVRGMNLVELAGLIADAPALASAAQDCASEAVRSYFRAGVRVSAASLDGVRARLGRLLRLPSSRLMLGASRTTSFHDLLANRIVLVDVGSPPLGCEDLGRFWSGLATLKLTRAIFQRTTAEAKRPVAVFIDEWQEGLAAGGDIAEQYERILAMARSRGVSLFLISQSLAGAARVSSVLPRVVATNTDLQLLFRASIEDTRALAHALPRTGRVPRPRAAPWEAPHRTPYLSAEEETVMRIEEAASLPNRTFYFLNRRRPYRAERVEAAQISFTTPFLSEATRRRLRHGALARPVEELANEARRADTSFRALGATPAAATAAATRPRPRRR